MDKLVLFTILCLSSFFLQAQKKAMTHEVYNQWTNISDTEISTDGNWILYSLSTEVGDKTSYLYNTKTMKEVKFERTSSPNIDANCGHVIFWRKSAYEDVRQLKLKKTKKDDLPTDTLSIYNLSNGEITTINEAKKFSSPEKWGNYLFVHLEPQDSKKDTTMPKPIKDENKDNGSKLLVIKLSDMSIDTLPYVLSYQVAQENPGLAYVGTSNDSVSVSNIYHYNLMTGSQTILTDADGKYSNLSFSEDSRNLAFIADLDTTEEAIRPFQLLISKNMTPAMTIANMESDIVPEGMMISKDRSPRFSKDNTRLFFGMAQIPLQPDTTLLDEEKPVVEVWNTNDPRLYTRQEVQLKRDKTKNFLYVYHIKSNSFAELGSPSIPNIELSKDGMESKVIGVDDKDYQKYVTWEGATYSDIYIIDINSGQKKKILTKIPGYVNNSPSGKYGYWYNRPESAYYTLSINTGESRNATATITSTIADELNDRPMDPSSYGMAGWTGDDKSILVYDRYDIWKVDPNGKVPAKNLTNGRNDKLVYRYIDLDREEEAIDMSSDIILSVFDENDKTAGYARLSPDGKLSTILKTKHSYSRRIWKAKNSNDIVYTKENFELFPDLLHSTTSFGKANRVSHANPQQSEYKWGSGKLYAWTDSYGNKQTGMLYTPEGFDPSQQYPMLVNFYERSSNGIYRHRAPYAGRSTIGYAYYLSKGYIIFNPDVNYEIGYPGQSAYNAAVSGSQSLIDEGFVDAKRIGLQGHSWGGYQIAHILTKTDMFACAESGAPVVNMISAYGGIRWGSGMSRMFQYERTQSRLGKTLWENPGLYLENSPIFEMDKVNTPILILHNDNDSAVPWYQGIEYFVALRRLNKPAWLLNYNGEPHWPLKWPNRLDFNRRMEQFFDHYLMDGPMPEWMENGVPAIEKSTNLGYKK